MGAELLQRWAAVTAGEELVWRLHVDIRGGGRRATPRNPATLVLNRAWPATAALAV